MEKITGGMGSASQANIRITSLKKTLATTLSPRVLLPAINKTYKQIEKNWKVRSYWVLDFGEGRCGPEISKFSLKEEDGYLIDKRTNELGMFKIGMSLYCVTGRSTCVHL